MTSINVNPESRFRQLQKSLIICNHFDRSRRIAAQRDHLPGIGSHQLEFEWGHIATRENQDMRGVRCG